MNVNHDSDTFLFEEEWICNEIIKGVYWLINKIIDL